VSIASARRDIERELAEIEQRRMKLQAALAALQGLDGAAPRRGRQARATAAAPATPSGGRVAASADGPRLRARRGETAGRVLDHLRAHPEDRGTAIASALGLSRANVNNTLTKLKRTGRLRQNGKRLVVVD
jgi:IclR helix-turn-helix domain